MFPIRGMVLKLDHTAPWMVYNKQSEDNNKDGERYEILAAFPPYPTPEKSLISSLFTG